MKREAGLLILVALMCLSLTSLASASLQHGIFGYIDNSKDGTSPNGATVIFQFYRGTDNYCTLKDVVGVDGNSGIPNWYSQDLGNCPLDWKAGDIVNVEIKKIPSTTKTTYVLTSNGSDQIPSVVLNSSQKTYLTVLLVIIIIILLTIVLAYILKKRQKFKNENA